jgi:GT2 family glycosyltransferase
VRELLKGALRRLLGVARYAEVRDWARDVRSPNGARGQAREKERVRGLELKARYKSYVIESLARRRVLERELAELRYPEHHHRELGVVAEVSENLAAPSTWSAPGSVSVIITNFNYGRYVAHAIDSVRRQTHDRVELMVVDDASSDASPNQLERMLGPAAPMPWQLLRLKHNVGLPAARNLGVKMARGEFVFILDADNHLLPDCVESHVRAAQESKADAAYGVVQTFGTFGGLLSDGEFSAERLARGPYIDAMALFRRSALLEMGLYSTEPALYGWEDYELWVRLAAQGRPVIFIPTVLSHYRFHQVNMSSVASLDTRGAWTYLFSSYPEIFGHFSPAERDREVERRSRLVGESANSTFEQEPAARVDCGCDDLQASGGTATPASAPER